MNLIVQILFGSHLYGTNTPTSDLDYKSVFVPFSRDILLQRVSNSVQIGGRNKLAGERNTQDDIDNEAYSLQRYLQLLSEGQTVAIDMLFAPNPIETTPLWEYIKFSKDKLLTKKSASFVGYCRTQANKYGIKGSRVAAAKTAMEMFEKFVLKNGPAVKVGDFFGTDNETFDDYTYTITKETPQNKTERYFVCCNRMVGFKNTVKEAANIFRKIHENYGDRARQADNNEGVDWKALSHAVRVGREAVELLQTHQITFPLPYASHILDIKQARIPYNQVAEEIEQLLIEVEKAAAVSTLRDEPDQMWIDDLVEEIYRQQISRT